MAIYRHSSGPLPRLLEYLPVTDPEQRSGNLDSLLFRGTIGDRDLDRRIFRLEERFRVYAATIPFGLWGEGLVISGEMRSLTDILLPMEEVRGAFRRLLELSIDFPFTLEGIPLDGPPSWLDLLELLDPPFRDPNPARLLRRLAQDGELRTRFLFSIFVPRRHGARAFRYPGQVEFIRHWLRGWGKERGRPICCLDAACGAGEGTLGLARLLLEEGFRPCEFKVVGANRNILEIFSAAHGFFPHDPPREEYYRLLRDELLGDGALHRIRFITGDLTSNVEWAGTFDIILCNGILGGPFMHDRRTLEHVVSGLAGCLRSGGVILAADRFHGGWKQVVPPEMLGEILAGAGLAVVAAGEGIGGIRGG